MSWWLWVSIGVGFFIVEIATPGGFYFIFFGVGAVLVGVADAAGVQLSLGLQLLLFAALSVVLAVLFRSRLQRSMAGAPARDIGSVVGSTGIAVGPIEPNELGQLELRGATWSARNVSTGTIVAGQRCKVDAVDGLTVKIRPE